MMDDCRMTQVLTISCKLKVSLSQATKLDATKAYGPLARMDAFAQALNWVNQKTLSSVGQPLPGHCFWGQGNPERNCPGRLAPLPPVYGGIRERINQQPRGKTERRRLNSWAFYQLRLFVHYKAVQAGVKVTLVPPAYSSQTCHRCLWLGQREGKRFRCVNPACGWEGDADFNGANVIALLGAVVNQPRGWLANCRAAVRVSVLKPALHASA